MVMGQVADMYGRFVAVELSTRVCAAAVKWTQVAQRTSDL
jgi:hypothetical protein